MISVGAFGPKLYVSSLDELLWLYCFYRQWIKKHSSPYPQLLEKIASIIGIREDSTLDPEIQIRWKGITILGMSISGWAIMDSFGASTNAFLDILAFTGVGISLAAWREAVKLYYDVEEISLSLPTRYLRPFPSHLQDIIRIISTAKRSVHILVDCIDYGSFSHPHDHDKIVRAITAAKLSGVDIHIQVCGDPQPISRSSEFWGLWQESAWRPEAWRELQRKADFQKAVKVYCRRNHDILHGIDPLSCEKEDFIALLTRKHEQVRLLMDGAIQARIKLSRQLKDMPGVFYWMMDNKEAVFVLSHTGAKTQGIAFFTRDIRIIQIFIDAWNNCVKANESNEENASFFEDIQSIDNFLRLYPDVKRGHISEMIKHETFPKPWWPWI